MLRNIPEEQDLFFFIIFKIQLCYVMSYLNMNRSMVFWDVILHLRVSGSHCLKGGTFLEMYHLPGDSVTCRKTGIHNNSAVETPESHECQLV